MNSYTYPDYFEWLCNIVNAGMGQPFWHYRKLLNRLFQTIYTPFYSNDESRASDGKDLRYYFDTNKDDYVGYGGITVAPYHPQGQFYAQSSIEDCSMLEMMIAFANKINTRYLYSNQVDRTFVWFWMMVESLGLATEHDMNFDDTSVNSEVDFILSEFNNGSMTYEDGSWHFNKSLFRLASEDLNISGEQLSLWNQMNRWYAKNSDWLEPVDPCEYVEYFMTEYGNPYS